MKDASSIYYKVSYVVIGGKSPGAIMSVGARPQIGDEVTFGGKVFEITEVMELMPAVADFGFLHATCKYLREAEEEGAGS